MSFSYSVWLIPLLFIIVFFIFLHNKRERHFFSWVEKYWFFKRAKKNKLASIFYYIGMSLLFLAILDLRGPEININAKVSKERTTILIDSSSSMLAEDVRPNRFEKAILLAKHYVKRSAGQHISVVVFSDARKKLIPFTNDIDLIEARLSSLEGLDLNHGGTSLKLAISETVQEIGALGQEKGNILVFTDAENTEELNDFKVPESIKLAIVGVGTLKGSVIPIRNKRGVFKGNKKFNGKEVITKLDEDFLRSIGKYVTYYQYWSASSYSLPTDEILSFFKQSSVLQEQKENIRIRPVLANYIMIPAVFSLIISYLLRMSSSFVMLSLSLLFILPLNLSAQVKKEKIVIPKTDLALKLEERYKENGLKKKEKRALVTEYLKSKHFKEAKGMYDEFDGELNDQDKMNKAVADFNTGSLASALDELKKLYEKHKDNKNSPLMDDIKKNMLKALMKQAQQKQQKKQDQNKDKKKDSKDPKNKNGQKGDDKKDDKKGKQENNKGKDEKNNKKKNQREDKKQNEKDGQDKKKDKGDNKDQDEKNNKKKQQNKTADPKDGKGRKKKKKLPALLKQLMSDDNNLQKKVIDRETRKSKSSDKKDW
ncbi:MAG: VWA domain-containing protein [Bacteriovoracaceae bacterium]|jgi:Ca-activated chloride channel family protein|nr:VWA domain-containing protein [Bacteriovoracaceae bacterium]